MADAMCAWAQAASTTPTTHVQLVAEQDCAISAMAEADYSHHQPFLHQRNVAIVAEIRGTTQADTQVDMWAEALRRAAPQAKPDAHARAVTAQVKAQMK